VIEQVTGEGTRVTFTLPAPEKHALAELVLHLKWNNDTYSPPKWKMKIRDFGRFVADMKPNSRQPAAAKENEVEDYLHNLLSLHERKPAQQKLEALAEPSRQRLQALSAHSNVRSQIVQTGSLKQQPHKSFVQSPSLPTQTARLDEEKLIRDCEFVRAICLKYHNSPPTDRVPNFPQLCSEVNEPQACSQAADRARKEFETSNH
jgi:hypothetical protein